MARITGSINKVKARTGQLRKRCRICGKRKYVSEMKKAGKRGTIQLYECRHLHAIKIPA